MQRINPTVKCTYSASIALFMKDCVVNKQKLTPEVKTVH